MANERSQSRPSWRPGGGPSTTPLSASGSGWRRAVEIPSARPARSSRSARLALGLMAAVGCYSVAVWIAFWLRPPSPAGLYMVGAGYLTNLAIPHNAHGLNVLGDLARLANSSKRWQWASDSDGVGSSVGPVLLGPDAFKSNDIQKFPEATVIIYVTGQGGGDEVNGAFLFRDDSEVLSKPDGEPGVSGRIYLKNVIAELARMKSKRFCLILDVSLAAANVPMGMIHNDFSRKLLELDPEISEARNLVVIAPASVGQRTWASDGWRQTVFGHFVVEGLGHRGRGDGLRVDSRKLFQYVESQVRHWTLRHRGQEQTPILLPIQEPAQVLELARASKVSGESPDEPDPVPIPKVLESRWRSRWMAYRELKVTSPEAHAPALWRTYRDLLLRHEALIRSIRPPESSSPEADPRSLQELEKELGGVAGEIEVARRISLDSSRNTLAMRAAEGQPLPQLQSFRADFARLWNPKPDDKVAITAQNRPAFYELLIRQVETASGPEDYDRARTLLDQLRDGDRPRPIEPHFLAILLRDAKAEAIRSAPYRELVGLALRVRRLAERTALGLSFDDAPAGPGAVYAEQVAPLIEGMVAEADRQRRKAEDLLFTEDPARWEVARIELIEAETTFHKAGVEAAKLRVALHDRDRSFADLPYHASWVAGRPADGQASTELLVETILAAWKQTHELTPVFSSHGRKSRPEVSSAGLADLHQIEARFREECLQKIREPARAEDYGSILALIDTPFLDEPDERGKLLSKLAIEARPAAPPEESDRASVVAEGRARAVRESITVGRRQGRLALAVLERRWFDDPSSLVATSAPGPSSKPSTLPETFDLVRQRLEPADLDKLPTLEALTSLTLAGSRIGRSRRQIPEFIGGLLQKGVTSLQDWPRSFQDADHLARLLVGGQLDQPNLPKADGPRPDRPTSAYRRRLLQRLLLVQARRTLDDHWYSEDDDPDVPESGRSKPYFLASAALFLDDLRGLALGDLRDDPGYVSVSSDLAAAARLGLKSPSRPLVVTDERALDLNYRIEAPSGSPGSDGRPVVWLSVDGDPNVRFSGLGGGVRRDVAIDSPQARPDASRPGRLGPLAARFDWQLDFSPIEKVARTPNAASRPFVARGSLRFEGRYRGQILRERTPFQVHPIPEVVVTQAPSKPTGDVSIEVDPSLVSQFGGNQGGALVIVLDCSGSMGPPPGKPDGPSKYKEATEALRVILRRVTQGTRVSLWVFGPAVASGSPTGPEDSIFRILPPTPWRPNDPGQIADLMRRIESPALVPYNRSPIVRTMLTAAEDFRNATGFKTMLVLTDGMDDCFESEVTPPGAPRLEIAGELRKAFARSDVEINIVGYKVSDGEEEVRQKFRVIQEFHRPGTFYPVRQADALADTLVRALRPTLRYSVQDLGNVLVEGEIELRGVGTSGGDFKTLRPGGYKLVVETGRRIERPMLIHRGDHLVVRMAERQGRIELNRIAWTDGLGSDVASRTLGGWRFAALQSQKRGDQLALRAALEKLPVLGEASLPGETALEVIRPREVWMEVRPGVAEGVRFQQRWSRLDAFPAPAWELLAPAWPDRPQVARPRLSAWWDPDQEMEPIATLPRADFPSIEEARDRVVPTELGEVVIESVELQDLPAEEGGGDGGRGSKRLVVRASSPKGSRFWIRPRGLRSDSSEHRFYTEAGKYTGLFWPLTEDQVRLSLTGLGLISVEKFQEQAERRGFAIKDLDARLPSTGDLGPPEVTAPALPVIPPLP